MLITRGIIMKTHHSSEEFIKSRDNWALFAVILLPLLPEIQSVLKQEWAHTCAKLTVTPQKVSKWKSWKVTPSWHRPCPLATAVHKGMRQRRGQWGTDTHTTAKPINSMLSGLVVIPFTPLHSQQLLMFPLTIMPVESNTVLKYKKNLFGEKASMQKFEGTKIRWWLTIVSRVRLTSHVHTSVLIIAMSIVGVHGWWLTFWGLREHIH